HREAGQDLLAELLTEPVLDSLLQGFVCRPGQRYPGTHPIELYVQQDVVLRRNLPEQFLPASLNQRLKVEHELARHVLEGCSQEPRLLRLGHPGRHEHGLDLRRGLHRGGHGIDQVGVPLRLPAALAQLEQRLGVVSGDGFVSQCPESKVARYSRTNLRSVSESSRSPISLEAAARERSTASRLRSWSARSRSAPISRRARAKSSSCSCLVFSIARARSFSATV